MKTSEDPRIQEFARILVEKGAEVEEGDNVYILAKSLESLALFEEVRRQVIEKGGFPHEHLLYDSQIGSEGMDRDWMRHASEEQLETVSEAKEKELEEMDAYIRIGGSDNSQELSGIDPSKVSKRKKSTQDLLDMRLGTKWVATRFPTDSMAQTAGMSTHEMEEFVFSAVNDTDWGDLEQKNQRVKEAFDDAEKVRIVGEGTDLELSLSGRKGVKASGGNNIPDGEVFYAPVKDSLNGRIEFTYPGIIQGTEVHGIRLEFENGRVTDFSAEKNEEFLEEMIGTDEGARYVGELGIGTNRNIQDYVGETLFDEKIGGSIHLALGRAYERCVPEDGERNISGIHWDIVKDLRPEFGGGQLIIDGEVVQEDGDWVF
jgi:aminopeptidase